MVVFTCAHCGESVQKPKVEKHYLTKCRNRNPNLSCMDCFKDFFGQDYETHIKCITEEERYSGKGFVAKEKKGEKKQNAWVEIVQSVLEEQKDAPKNVLRIIETVSKHNNTPRKKPKFINFVKNVCGHKTNSKDIDQAWDLISVKLSALSNTNDEIKSQNNSVSQCIEDNSTEANHSKEPVKLLDENNSLVEDTTDLLNLEKKDGHVEKTTDLLDSKKISKKQRKEEKKRKKYEEELQKAAIPQPIELENKENQTNKKDKKKKNKGDSKTSQSHIDEENPESQEGKDKNKKRKRQDTSNGLIEPVNEVDTSENVEINLNGSGDQDGMPGIKPKTQKKKLKMDTNGIIDKSICLHDQNVANGEELTVRNDKFDWHNVIISVLTKKDNELPFKRLQKKVLSEYSEATGNEVDERIAEKFIKKLKSAPKVKVDKNRVILEQ